MPTTDSGVPDTAAWTAAARAVESERPDALFVDPYARELAGPEGFARATALERFTGGGPNPVLPLRTRFFDLVALAAGGAGIGQIVLLAAGLDVRAYRLDLPAGSTVFEIDDPGLLRSKQETLDRLGARPVCGRRTVPADLTGDWAAPLAAAGWRADRPTSWIAEGLLPYLDEDAVAGLLRAAATASAPGSRLAADTLGRAFLHSERMDGQRAALAEMGAPWRSGCDDPAALLTSTGWRPELVLQPGQPGADFRPLPFPVVPLEVVDTTVPRILFFEGRT